MTAGERIELSRLILYLTPLTAGKNILELQELIETYEAKRMMALWEVAKAASFEDGYGYRLWLRSK